MPSQFMKPFSTPFLSDFILTPSLLPFEDQELIASDQKLFDFERVFMDPDFEKHLLTRSELLASFAISKAEQSSLTLAEAEDLYDVLVSHKELDFIKKKLRAKKPLNRKDYEKMEFFNIAKTFRRLNQAPFDVKNITPDFIRNVHADLTQGMDIFQQVLPAFTGYRSGKFRADDSVRVGSYIPAPHGQIKAGVQELVQWLKKHISVRNIAVFHTALYALHPFQNGNKRVCRLLEHLLFRSLGLNARNLYSTSTYYHQEKARYYKYLLFSLQGKNLTHLSAFILEALFLSFVAVIKNSLELERRHFMKKRLLDKKVRSVIAPLIKRQELPFKTLWKFSKGKMARQTFVTALQKAVAEGIAKSRPQGRSVYYALNFTPSEQPMLIEWIHFAKERLPHVPDHIALW